MRVSNREIWGTTEVRLANKRIRVSMGGWLSCNYKTKIFAATGNGGSTGNPRRQGTIISASTQEMLMQGGMRLQSYWQFQYDISVGNLPQIGKALGIRNLAAARLEGVCNVLQNFDVLPGRGRNSDYEVTFLNATCDRRGGNMSLWEFDLDHERSTSSSSGTATIVTTTTATLPLEFSASISAEVSAQLGAELSGEPAGMGAALSVGAGTSTGASINFSFRRRLEVTMEAEIYVPTTLNTRRR